MVLHPPWSHEDRFADDPRSASQARAFVREHLVEHGLDGLVEDVGLVVSELATNAVRHTGTPFTVFLRGAPQWVVVGVEDGSARVPQQVTAEPLDLGGRGLDIVDQVSRDWGVRAGGRSKAVWARFDLP
ncbi:MAG TPA: ATP-binding protein [Marmoricola sp.]|nr:ATP-binding protein [Marmoricola sp.]